MAAGWKTRCLYCTFAVMAEDAPALARAEVLVGEHEVAVHRARPCGTRAKYVQERCRCQACSEANRAYARHRDTLEREVRFALLDASPARAHLAVLSEHGTGLHHVARVSGLGRTALTKIVSGATRRVRPETMAAILAVVPGEDVAGGVPVDAAPAWRDVEALLELGYPKAWISGQIGGGGRALQIGKVRVRASTAEALRELRERVGSLRYDERSGLTVRDESRLTGRLAGLLEPQASRVADRPARRRPGRAPGP